MLEEQKIGPKPFQEGGPPIWVGSHVRAGIERAGKHFDGWFPTGPNAESFRDQMTQVQAVAEQVGRDPRAITAAIYLTMRIDDDAQAADRHIDEYLVNYYGAAGTGMKSSQACFAGSKNAAIDWIQGFIDAGAEHLMIRFAGDHERQMELLPGIRDALSV